LTAIADEVIEMSGLSFEAARIDNRSQVSFGSKAPFRKCAEHVRLASVSGGKADIPKMTSGPRAAVAPSADMM
jgi:hypothetical protein